MHHREILHANLKPSNCLLDSHQNIKLSDFGYLTLYDSDILRTVNSTRSVGNRIEYLKSLIYKCEVCNENYLPIETNEFYEYYYSSESYCVAAIFYELIAVQRYHWSRFEVIKTELAKLRAKTNENFAHLLNAMLSNSHKNRPTASMIHVHNEWQRFVEIRTVIKEGESAVSNHCAWKSEQRFVIKRIKINKVGLIPI